MKITASLVLYCTANDVFEPAIRSVIESDVDVILSIFDNSPTALASKWFGHSRVRYHHGGANVGFGAGHNAAFAAVAGDSDVHIIVNPDVNFGPRVISFLADIFAKGTDVAAAMPAIHDEMDQRQHLCKALPTPLHLIVRRFMPFAAVRRAIDATYEFRALPSSGLIDIPNLSGCFLAVRSSAFLAEGGFDERYFMYMEDVDLVRRLGDRGRTVFAPEAKVYHAHARSSYRFGKLMLIHMRSAASYFAKWGWLHDPARRARNTAARAALSSDAGSISREY